MKQTLEAMLVSTGEWVELSSWDDGDAEYDAAGWLDCWGLRIGGGVAKLPCGGFVDLSGFIAIRAKPEQHP